MNNETSNRMSDDELDLLATLKVTRMELRQSGGYWLDGTMADHRFQALVFPEHAEQPEYELGQSRISKLWIRRRADRVVVANFDRGWDVRPVSKVAEQIVDLLAAGLAESVLEL